MWELSIYAPMENTRYFVARSAQINTQILSSNIRCIVVRSFIRTILDLTFKHVNNSQNKKRCVAANHGQSNSKTIFGIFLFYNNYIIRDWIFFNPHIAPCRNSNTKSVTVCTCHWNFYYSGCIPVLHDIVNSRLFQNESIHWANISTLWWLGSKCNNNKCNWIL